MLIRNDFEQGMLVRLITDYPRHGLGAVRQGDLGIVGRFSERNSEDMYVDFGRQREWLGIPSDLEIIRGPFELVLGMKVRTTLSTGKMGIGNKAEITEIRINEADVRLMNSGVIQVVPLYRLYPADMSNKASKNALDNF